ncbi:MAG: hypothetical protein EA428_05755 [Spirochaetaceae bacterium]|nr:MAG: hypothetical protein EA428_05755 [Spirochaetaceae bacterium]
MVELFVQVMHPSILFPWFMAMLFGIFAGATPGLTATMATALIVPISYYMSPLAGLAMIIGATFTAIFAGDIPATFLRIPGTPASSAATLDGYQLTLQGKGGYALTLDLICSALGGLMGVGILIFVAPPLAQLALRFSSAEYFWLGLFGLSMSAVVSKGNTFRGIIAACFGLLVSTVGMDVTTGHPRFTFGQLDLLSGVGFIPAMIGLFGLSEVLKLVSNRDALRQPSIASAVKISLRKALPVVWRHKFTVLRSGGIGTVIGALPGAGADIAAWVSYGMAKKFSRNPDKFGTGADEGVIAPTSANNAGLAGAWIPALVFGVPGDSITAIVVGAMLMYGLRPGPLIFEQSRELVNGIFLIAVLTQFMLIGVGLLGIKAFGRILQLPRNAVIVIVLMFSIVGSFALQNSIFDIYIMIAFGIIGFYLEKNDVPLPPLILGLILGPMVERNLRVGLVRTQGDFLPFLTRPVSSVLAIALFITLFGGPILGLLRRLLSKYAAKRNEP